MPFSKFLDPKLDLTFKKIFGTKANSNILIHFLNDILGCTEINVIEKITFINTALNPEFKDEKQSIVDVLCEDSVGNQFIVEMQLARDKSFEERAQAYAAKVYSRQSARYADLKKVFFIAISNSILFPNKSNYISTHTFSDEETNERDLKGFQFVFIELPKFKKDKVEQLTTIVERWCFFFKHAQNTTDEDLKDMEEKSPVIRQAYDQLDQYSWSREELAVYHDRLDILQKEEGILEQKFDEGEAKGKAEGKAEMAKNLLKAGVSIDIVAESSGLSVDEIKELN